MAVSGGQHRAAYRRWKRRNGEVFEAIAERVARSRRPSVRRVASAAGVNNNFTSYIARDIVRENPELRARLQLRRSR